MISCCKLASLNVYGRCVVLWSSLHTEQSLEKSYIPHVSLINFLHLSYDELPLESRSNPILMSTWCTWQRICTLQQLNTQFTLYLSLVRNLDFQLYSVFSVGHSKCLTSIQQLISMSEKTIPLSLKMSFLVDSFF